MMSSSLAVKSAVGGLIVNFTLVVVLLAIALSVLPHDNHSEDNKDLQVIKDLHLPEEENNDDLPQIQQEIADIYREKDPQKPALHVEIAPDFNSTVNRFTPTIFKKLDVFLYARLFYLDYMSEAVRILRDTKSHSLPAEHEKPSYQDRDCIGIYYGARLLGENDKIDKEAVLTWHNCSSECYDSNHIEYSNGFFTIKVEGYYYIYSTIRYSGSGTEELDYGRIVHRIEKADEQTSESRKRTPSTLMQNFKSTPVIRRGRLAYTTSSLAGTFFLPERSKVTVYSSIPDNIDKSPRGTIFGLFLM